MKRAIRVRPVEFVTSKNQICFVTNFRRHMIRQNSSGESASILDSELMIPYRGRQPVQHPFHLGLSALLRPLILHLQILKLELPVIIAAAALMTGLAWDGVLSSFDGGVMFCAAILYTVALVRMSRRERQAVQDEFKEAYGADDVITGQTAMRIRAKYAALLAAGLGLSALGAD